MTHITNVTNRTSFAIKKTFQITFGGCSWIDLSAGITWASSLGACVLNLGPFCMIFAIAQNYFMCMSCTTAVYFIPHSQKAGHLHKPKTTQRAFFFTPHNPHKHTAGLCSLAGFQKVQIKKYTTCPQSRLRPTYLELLFHRF